MTDEQTKAVKALRDACVTTTDEMVKLATHCYNKNMIEYKQWKEWVELADQATEAIKEVERWIV